ncbi:MAG: multiple sugar transport system substrate-binding protein, partial [Thermoleophilaceae bacterium]|nr:multiple sugar transport system substrate-binding protein [Thermoleophilaceae bacterium]
ANDADGKVLDIKENYGGEWPTYGFLPVVYSTGSVVVKDNRAEGNLNSPAVVKAVKEFAGWRKFVDPNTDDKAFVTGRVALSWVGHWLYNDYQKALGDDLVVLPLPNFGAGAKSGQGSLSWGISSRTKNAAAAARFLDFLMSDGPVTAMTDANAAPPGTKTVAAQSSLYKPGGPLELFAQQLERTCGSGAPTEQCIATPRPVSAAYGVISQEFSKAFFTAYNGGDAQQQLDKAARAIDLDFQDNKNYGLR